MRLTIDSETRQLAVESEGGSKALDLYSKEAFELVSQWWLKLGWNQKYVYTFSWLGRPIIQLPEDMVRTQEAIFALKPDVIVETGVAHGGSLVFYAGLCRLIGKGRVIGVDIEIRPHNRKAIEAHFLHDLITLIEGDSAAASTVAQVRSHIKPGQVVLVLLDSCHTRQHVLNELEAYSPLVTPGSYIVATDGIMELVHDVPRGQKEWKSDNPAEAARDFARRHGLFEIVQPPWPFNESPLDKNVTHWPAAWLRRKA